MNIPKNQSDLARMLGIAKSAVSNQVKRGMPTTSLEEAQAWRKSNLDPGRRKGARFDKYRKPGQKSQIENINEMLQWADDELQNGRQIVAQAHEISLSMRSVPDNRREQIKATKRVTSALVDFHLGLTHDMNEQPTDDVQPGVFCDDDRQFLEELRYSLASGELLQNHQNQLGEI